MRQIPSVRRKPSHLLGFLAVALPTVLDIQDKPRKGSLFWQTEVGEALKREARWQRRRKPLFVETVGHQIVAVPPKKISTRTIQPSSEDKTKVYKEAFEILSWMRRSGIDFEDIEATLDVSLTEVLKLTELTEEIKSHPKRFSVPREIAVEEISAFRKFLLETLPKCDVGTLPVGLTAVRSKAANAIVDLCRGASSKGSDGGSVGNTSSRVTSSPPRVWLLNETHLEKGMDLVKKSKSVTHVKLDPVLEMLKLSPPKFLDGLIGRSYLFDQLKAVCDIVGGHLRLLSMAEMVKQLMKPAVDRLDSWVGDILRHNLDYP